MMLASKRLKCNPFPVASSSQSLSTNGSFASYNGLDLRLYFPNYIRVHIHTMTRLFELGDER